MAHENEWKGLAIERQYYFFESLGTRSYDEIEKTNLFLLKKKVGFATCGKPSEMPTSANYNTGYTAEELDRIKPICEKIIEKSDYDPIRFSCTVLTLQKEGSLCDFSIFRIVTSSGNIFIDPHTRVYQSWQQFMEKNKLPDCEYCYPLNGNYDATEKLVGFALSPANSLFMKTTECLDTVGSVASVGAAGVFATSTFITVAPVLATAAGATAICTGVYSITRSISSLYDRNKHEQSVGLQDPEARSAWLSIGSSAVGMATMAAIKGAEKVVKSGKALSKLSIFGLHTLTASSLAFSGFGFVENLIICADKYNKGRLTKKDVFDLSCELLFLFNAIVSAKATTQLVNNMNAVFTEGTSGLGETSQKKLTKTQKRNLRKRAAKRRAKGVPNVKEEPNRVFNIGDSTFKILFLEAVSVYCPRIEKILYEFQSIGHDVLCWRGKEMSDIVLMKNLTRKLVCFYNDFKEEITDALNKVVKFFSSFSFDDFLKYIYALFETSLEEIKSTFCTKIISTEDEMEALIIETEKEISDLHDSLQIESNENGSAISDSIECENYDDNDLNPETRHILIACRDVINNNNLTCNDLKAFEDILDGVKYVFIAEYKTRLSYYKKFLQAAKSASGEQFNLKSFHESLGIKSDVSQNIFNETMNDLTAAGLMNKIRSKCKEIHEQRNNTNATPVWETLTEGIFHYYGPHGKGGLSRHQLLSIVNSVMKSYFKNEEKVPLADENCSFLEGKDVLMITVNGHSDLQIVVYCGLTETNTASGIITVVK